jgi:hypothetical protein
MSKSQGIFIPCPKFNINEEVVVKTYTDCIHTCISSRLFDFDERRWWYRVKSGRFYKSIFCESAIMPLR